MFFHWEESATTKTAPFRRNPPGAGGPPTYQTEAAGAPQALSGIAKTGHDDKTAPAASVSNLGGRSSLRAANPKTPARGPRDFCHRLLGVHPDLSYRKRTSPALNRWKRGLGICYRKLLRNRYADTRTRNIDGQRLSAYIFAVICLELDKILTGC